MGSGSARWSQIVAAVPGSSTSGSGCTSCLCVRSADCASITAGAGSAPVPRARAVPNSVAERGRMRARLARARLRGLRRHIAGGRCDRRGRARRRGLGRRGLRRSLGGGLDSGLGRRRCLAGRGSLGRFGRSLGAGLHATVSRVLGVPVALARALALGVRRSRRQGRGVLALDRLHEQIARAGRERRAREEQRRERQAYGRAAKAGAALWLQGLGRARARPVAGPPGKRRPARAGRGGTSGSTGGVSVVACAVLPSLFERRGRHIGADLQ